MVLLAIALVYTHSNESSICPFFAFLLA